jgi:hypothetical protein
MVVPPRESYKVNDAVDAVGEELDLVQALKNATLHVTAIAKRIVFFILNFYLLIKKCF